MSFASQAREEIARRSLQKDCCVRAAAYGIACFAKYFDASGLVLQTEQELTTQVASQLFARCGVQGDIIEKQFLFLFAIDRFSFHWLLKVVAFVFLI